MQPEYNQQSDPDESEAFHQSSLRGYLGKIAAGAMQIGFVSTGIVGGTEIVSRVMGEADHVSVPVAVAMATGIYASSHRHRE